jgi:hypothetical protein
VEPVVHEVLPTETAKVDSLEDFHQRHPQRVVLEGVPKEEEAK